MATIQVPPGMTMAQAADRLKGGGLYIPKLVQSTTGVDHGSSNRPAWTFVTHATVAHSPGTLVEIASAVPEDVGYVRIVPANDVFSSSTNTSALFSLWTGASSAEVAVLEGIAAGWWGGATATQHGGWIFPIFIPKGTRVTGRVQGIQLSKTVQFRIEFYSLTHGLIPSSKIVGIGIDSANSKGTNLTVAGSINTKSAWTVISASTTEPLAALGVSIQGAGDTSQANANILVDIGIGSAGNEIVIVPDLYLASTITEVFNPTLPMVHPVNVPQGSRLVARYQASSITGLLDVVIHGVRPPL